MVRFRPVSRKSWLALGLALVVLSSSAAMATGGKPKGFTTTISPDAGLVAGATEVSFTATFTNKDKSVLDAIDLTAPLGFKIASTAEPLPGGSATIDGSVLELRELNLYQGQSSTVQFTGAVACKDGQYTWVAKEPRSKHADKGRKPGRTSSAETEVEGNCSAAFVAPGPQDADKSDEESFVPIRTVDGDPDSPPVQVAILDGAGAPLGASHPLANVGVSVEIATNPSGGSLVGQTSASAVGGVATFHDGFGITESGIDYVLRAVPDSHDIQSGLSDPLSIWDAVTFCETSGSCSTGVATSPEGLEGVVTLPDADAGDTVFEGWNVESLNDCDGYEFLSDDQLTFGSTGSSFRVIEVVIPDSGGHSYTGKGKGKPKVQVCFSSSSLQFKTRAGELAELDPDGFFTGLLPDHKQFHWLGGCEDAPQILDRKSMGSDVVVKYCAPAGASKGHS
jgi:hypothetical protein